MSEISDVQEPVMSYALQRGFIVRRMKYIGRRSCADVFLFKAGMTFQIEFKNAGEQPSIQQLREHDRFAQEGIMVHVVDDAREGCALVDRFLKWTLAK